MSAEDSELAALQRLLPPLTTTGCVVPLVALARATYLRQRALDILWREAQEAGERERLLALLCARTAVHWWCRPALAPLLALLRGGEGRRNGPLASGGKI
jgi:hypothetical protein